MVKKQADMKNILMIAYHFPPVQVSSGIQRTLKFSQYLLEHGWRAQVLTVNPRAYIQVNAGQLNEIPKQVTVKRAFALDTSRHLAIKGRYLGWMALPDRWVSWCFGGVVSGLNLIRQYKPQVIWSTYPIATAHLLGLILHRITGIPWVADFRDSMTEDNYPANPKQWAVYRWIEKQTVRFCSKAVFTTPGAIAMYAARYPDIPDSRWALIPNGFDEENFVQAERKLANNQLSRKNDAPLVLLHSGVLYPSERDPTMFFKALAGLLEKGVIDRKRVKIILRATGHDDLHARLIEQNGLQDVVFLEPGIAYSDALIEMLSVDGLLVFQASNCNHQIPAKVYEYLRAQKPVFALTDPEGDTAGVLRQAGVGYIVPLDDQAAIEKNMADFLTQLQQGQLKPSNSPVEQYSRKFRSQQLAKLLDELVDDN
jgi:hypothetical protein